MVRRGETMMSDSSNYVREDERGVLRVGETRVAFDSVAAAAR